MPKPPLFTHICCAPDAAYVVGLLQKDYDVTGYFYNPNIGPPAEYALRLSETRKVERLLGFGLEEGDYEQDLWSRLTRGFRDEPEKGRRCDICYALRLDRTARKAVESGFPAFTTIMSVSPWKKADVINRIGRLIGRKHGLRFLEADFKKKGGFQKSVELSRLYGLYRQNYCGCIYSRRDTIDK
jgi:predicted adenine nucleotide alpha hydrolase (AANH) superfamily ATPase